jgi:hypothetical protein
MARKKRNDDSPKFADWTTKKLKQYAISYNEAIYGENSCYGTRDILILEGILNELENRNVSTTKTFQF